MKTTLFFLAILILLTGCGKLDNYPAPKLTLSGKVIDSQTNDMIENGGGNGGTVIKTLEGKSTQTFLMPSYPDGHFINALVFPANYKIWAEGAFTMTGDTLRQSVTSNTDVVIKVIPNVRVTATLIDVTGAVAHVKIRYEKLDPTQTLTQIGFAWSTFPNPNATVYPGGAVTLDDVSALSATTGEQTYTITNFVPQTQYYIRGLARTNNSGAYYNYSKQLTLTTP